VEDRTGAPCAGPLTTPVVGAFSMQIHRREVFWVKRGELDREENGRCAADNCVGA
jgi:hypothetical protein